MDTFDKILTLLNEKGHSQKELTDYLGLEKSVFSTWKAGKSQSYKKYIDKIADFLDVTPDVLMGYSEKSEYDSLPEDLKVFCRKAKKLLPENRKKLFDVANAMFKEEFDD